MRQIKFRAWDNVKGKMYYVGEDDNIVFYFTSVGITAQDTTEDEDEFKYLEHLTYMQYTGLTDRNGKEIYEGDIVKYQSKERTGTRVSYKRRGYETYSIHSDIEIIGCVKFGESDGLFTFIVDTEQVTKYESYFWGEGKRTDRPSIVTNPLVKPLSTKREYEIIGNIYEHHQLLQS